jgi:hypothetical protein
MELNGTGSGYAENYRTFKIHCFLKSRDAIPLSYFLAHLAVVELLQGDAELVNHGLGLV